MNTTKKRGITMILSIVVTIALSALLAQGISQAYKIPGQSPDPLKGIVTKGCTKSRLLNPIGNPYSCVYRSMVWKSSNGKDWEDAGFIIGWLSMGYTNIERLVSVVGDSPDKIPLYLRGKKVSYTQTVYIWNSANGSPIYTNQLISIQQPLYVAKEITAQCNQFLPCDATNGIFPRYTVSETHP